MRKKKEDLQGKKLQTGQKNQLFIKQINSLPDFLRCLNYGYSRQTAKNKLAQSGTYDKLLKKLKYALPNEHLNETIDGKSHIYSLHGDAYHTQENFLLPLLNMMTIDPQHILCAIMILDTLNKAPSETVEALVTRVQDQLTNFFSPLDKHNSSQQSTSNFFIFARQYQDTDWKSTIRKFIKELLRMGYIIKKEKSIKIATPLEKDFAPEEIKKLKYAVAFCSAAAPYSLPGCYLLQSLTKTEKLDSYYVIKNVDYTRLVTDPYVYILIKAKKQKKPVSFKEIRRGQYTYEETLNKKIYPEKIGYVIDLKLNPYKNRAVYLHTNGKLNWFLLSDISDLKIEENLFSLPSATLQLVLEINPDFPEKHAEMQKLLRARFSHPRFEKKNQQCIVNIRKTDKMDILPWIYSLHPYIKIKDDLNNNVKKTKKRTKKQTIKEIIKKRTQEALDNYGQLLKK